MLSSPAPFIEIPHGTVPVRGPGSAYYLAAVLAAGAFAVVLAGIDSTVFELERHAVPKEFVLHATALLCLPALLRGWRRVAPGIVEALLGAFVLWSALSALLATNRWLALNGLGVSVSGLVLFLAARRVASERRARFIALAGLGLAATLAALLGAGQAYGLQFEWLAEDRPPGGTFGNRNFLAHVLAIASPPALLAALRARSRVTASLAAVSLLVMTGAIVLTRSRAAWLGLMVSIVVMAGAVVLGRRAYPGLVRRRRLLAAALAMAAGITLAVLLPNRLAWRTAAPYAETLSRLTDYTSGSGRGRLVQWRNSLRLVADAPVFGVGPGNWFVHYPRVTSPGDPSFAGADPIPTNPWPSSDWVAFLVERGVPGALLLLFAGVAAAIVAARRFLVRSSAPWPDAGFDPDEPKAARAIAALGVLAAAVATGLFDAVLLLAAPTFFVWTGIGLLLPATRPLFARTFDGRRRRAIVFGVALFIGFIVVVSAGRMASLIVARDRPTRAQLVTAARLDPGGHRVRLLLLRRGSCQNRLPHARAAARLMPFHAAPARALRACGIRASGPRPLDIGASSGHVAATVPMRRA